MATDVRKWAERAYRNMTATHGRIEAEMEKDRQASEAKSCEIRPTEEERHGAAGRGASSRTGDSTYPDSSGYSA